MSQVFVVVFVVVVVVVVVVGLWGSNVPMRVTTCSFSMIAKAVSRKPLGNCKLLRVPVVSLFVLLFVQVPSKLQLANCGVRTVSLPRRTVDEQEMYTRCRHHDQIDIMVKRVPSTRADSTNFSYY